jgi:hypothetical protein
MPKWARGGCCFVRSFATRSTYSLLEWCIVEVDYGFRKIRQYIMNSTNLVNLV